MAINCGALPENLIESELFGHRKGPLPARIRNAKDCSKLPTVARSSSTKLGNSRRDAGQAARVLESGEIRRVGDNEPFKVDVRVVCATHRDTEQMVEQGEFREDLMFRINTFEIHRAVAA